jgi:predicted GNAT family N-acyltransferase
MSHLSIKTVSYNEELTNIQTIRRNVFQEEQGVAFELEFDGLDEASEHLLAYLDDRAVGTIRIRALDAQTAKIERLAVLAFARGRGIGKQLMQSAIATVEAKSSCKVIMIHAQDYIKDLYTKLGFEIVGKPFYEAKILHVKMLKPISRIE